MIEWAGGAGNVEIVEYVLEAGIPISHNSGRKRDGKNLVHFAARNGRVAMVRYILGNIGRFGIDSDTVTNDGTTALMLAAYGGSVETVRLLIDTFKCDVFRKNEWGCGVAHFIGISSETCDPDSSVIELLEEKGVDFEEKQDGGHTPVHKASMKGNGRVVKKLYDVLGKVEGARERMGKARDKDGKRASELCKNEKLKEWMVKVGW